MEFSNEDIIKSLEATIRNSDDTIVQLWKTNKDLERENEVLKGYIEILEKANVKSKENLEHLQDGTREFMLKYIQGRQK